MELYIPSLFKTLSHPPNRNRWNGKMRSKEQQSWSRWYPLSQALLTHWSGSCNSRDCWSRNRSWQWSSRLQVSQRILACISSTEETESVFRRNQPPTLVRDRPCCCLVGFFQDWSHTRRGFYGHRATMYRNATPHRGFQILKDILKAKNDNFFIFTSNIDTQFQTAGFPEDKIYGMLIERYINWIA